MPVFQVEMLWRCSACQTEVLGRHKTCPTCGKPKNAEEFYSANPATVEDAVTAPELLELAAAGADWECRYCRNRQGNAKQACSGWGLPERKIVQLRPPLPFRWMVAPLPSAASHRGALLAKLRR